MNPSCQQCGRPIEDERLEYVVPTCFACVPPPEPLPVAHLKSSRLYPWPVTLTEAREYCRKWHRTHRPPQGGLFAVACAHYGQTPCGVAIVGRPVARHLDDGWTAEVTRVATDGTKNACSFLYGACWRAARALGYIRLVTYTLRVEPGTSLRAAGFEAVHETKSERWTRPARERFDEDAPQQKIRWERCAELGQLAQGGVA